MGWRSSLRRALEQAIPYEAANAQRPAARAADHGRNPARLVFEVHVNSI